jgi:HEPN domain-containing protein
MKQTTREWVDKAEADYAIALLVSRSRKKYSRDIICFHLQQCVEEYLRLRLFDAGIAFPADFFNPGPPVGLNPRQHYTAP